MTHRFALPLTAALIALGLPGCAMVKKPESMATSVEQRYPIAVSADTATYQLDAPAGTTRLTPNLAAETRAFLASYKTRGHGGLTISAPQGSANAKNAKSIALDVGRLAGEAGLAPEDVILTTYSASEPNAPIVLSYTRYVASVKECGDWSKNLGRSLQNNPFPNFGCATQNNIAAMVEDPHDLLAPRQVEASDAERRAKVFQKYRNGESSATPRTDDERANVSKVAQ